MAANEKIVAHTEVTTPAPAGPDQASPQSPSASPGSASAPEVKSGAWNIINNVIVVGILLAALYYGLLRGKSFEESLDTITYVIKVILGLGFLIFIHELGHFVAAKLCNVRVEAFSIGFGPAIPGCHFKSGETEYKLALFPIGGYVKMPGEYPSEAQDDDIKNDPRTFMNQTVGERMFIISAGVIMNMVFGFLVFIYVYTQGKTERAPFFGGIEPGSPAFAAGLRAGAGLQEVQDYHNPSYDDLFFTSALSTPGKTEVHLKWQLPDGTEQQATVIPRRSKLDLKPSMGIGFPHGLRLYRLEKADKVPATPGTPASKAAFRGGDMFTGIRPKGVLWDEQFRPLKSGWDYQWSEQEFRSQTVEIQFERNKQQMSLDVEPAFMHTFGLRLEMGPIVALVTQNAPKSTALFKEGDLLVALNGRGDLDPIRLPDTLTEMAERGEKIELTVLRGGQRVPIHVDLNDFKGRGTWVEFSARSMSPMAIPALGIAYRVLPTIAGVDKDSPAAKAGLKPGQKLSAIKVPSSDPDDENKTVQEATLKIDDDEYQWPYLFWFLQLTQFRTWHLTVTDAAGAEQTVTMTAVEDRTWPVPHRGFKLEMGQRIRVAESIREAIELGWKDTYQFVGRIYKNLYSLVRGDMSPRLLSGPLKMAEITYNVAGLSFTEFIHFLAIISINLAVVNFLPIPVLDGGHMVLLIIEKIRGKPVSERILVIVTITGLVIVLCLMAFTVVIDITNFEWFKKLF